MFVYTRKIDSLERQRMILCDGKLTGEKTIESSQAKNLSTAIKPCTSLTIGLCHQTRGRPQFPFL